LPLPLLPLRIGLVTSAGSAAYHDFVTELDRSSFAWHVQLVDTRVQGAGADAQVELALRVLERRGVDLVALVRGGGSRVDLAAFDTERVARAIATLSIPVLTGIGHEIDRSVADDVGHTAYKTPTACAAGLVAHVSAYLDRADRAYLSVCVAAQRTLDHHERQLRVTAEHCARATRAALAVHAVRVDHLVDRLERDTRHALARGRSRLDRAEGRLTADATRHLRGADAEITDAAARLRARVPRVLAEAQRHVDALASHARAHDPARVLARGWSLTRRADGTLVRSIDDAPPGTTVVTTVGDGSLSSTITRAERDAEKD
jgi:exodeoxyribonuclease VII large subunit